MAECPACGGEAPDTGSPCPSCGLSYDLFEPLRLAVSRPRSDPRYLDEVREFLDALGELATEGGTSVAALSKAGRFPSAPAARARPAPSKVSGKGRPTLPRPALPAAATAAEIRREVHDLLLIGRRQGVDITEFTEREHALPASGLASAIEPLHRDLFVHVAAALGDTLENEGARRAEIALFLPTGPIEAELETARGALESSDLAGAQRSLLRAGELLNEVAEEWGSVEVLLGEGEILAESIKGFGGDPAPAIGPIEEGRRLALKKERDRSERLLARGILGLWTILHPLLERDLTRRVADIARLKGEGAPIGPAVAELRLFAARLHERDYVASMQAYRSAGQALDTLSRRAPGSPTSSSSPLNTNAKLPHA